MEAPLITVEKPVELPALDPGIASVLSGEYAWKVVVGDALAVLRTMPSESVHCVVCSPPYWGLRDYGVEGQIGLEPTHVEFIVRLVEVFDEVKRVLRKDGTCWVNIGDCYAGSSGGGHGKRGPIAAKQTEPSTYSATRIRTSKITNGLKPKDLVGIPWRLAFAMQDAGWWLRAENIWAKKNPMPEGDIDRPWRTHEQVFMFTRSATYFYDRDAVRTDLAPKTKARDMPERRPRLTEEGELAGANLRDVWHIASEPFDGAHFATMPTDLVKPCILGGCPKGGVVLDPFAGAGTVGVVAMRLGRRFLGIDLNPEYVGIARKRIEDDAPLFNGRTS